MRKAQKEQAEKLISLLGRVHDGIRMSIETGKKDQALDFLEQCQSGAISLGEAIEETEGEGFVTVTLLEAYCEAVYQIYEKIRQGQHVGANQAFKSLRSSLTQVKNSVNNDIRVRTEAVFLPYKASMWDSLESVWKAADEDPECDAYVIPIPYYDRNPDGSFREEHYEGGLYPDYVPVTPYQEYDFAERRPDVVFIHNPYDDENYVTSVHPFFYSRNLKKYTDFLVYIPYFILGETMYESLCVSQGAFFSDMIVTQSERTKKDFKTYLKKWYQENTNADDKLLDTMLEKKLQPLGSPKIDKIVHSDKYSYALPEEWKRMLHGKKAVLYNTGVTGILNGNEQELKKMRDTINVFRSRKDVVLWWRPHPLSMGTIQSMRPGLYEEYLGIIEEYKASGIGIFDDTTDLYRALLWTDLYYGDDSSLIYLYGVQGKPIVMQNIYYLSEVHGSGKDRTINYQVSCLVSDKVYFTAKSYNRLYRMDLITEKVEDLGAIPGEYETEMSLYSNMLYENGSLWMIPSRAHALAVYCIDSGRWTQYDLPDRVKSSAIIQGKIYMITSDYQFLWTMDLKGRELKRKAIMYQNQEVLPFSEEYYNGDLYLTGDRLYYLVTHSNLLAEYDLETGKAKLLSMGPEENLYQRLLYQDGLFWMIPSWAASTAACWDKAEIKFAEKNVFPTGFTLKWGFSEAVCRKDDVLLFPQRGNMILEMNKRSMETECLLQFDRNLDVQDVKVLSDGKIVFVTSAAGLQCCMTIMDSEGTVVKTYEIVCPDGAEPDTERMFERIDREKYHSRWSYQIPEVRESDIAAVCDALAKTEDVNRAERAYFRSLYANSEGNSGRSIWEEVKNVKAQ